MDFVIERSDNPERLETFKNDPAGTVASAGFYGDEAEALVSRDYRKLKRLLEPANKVFGDDSPLDFQHAPIKKKKKPAPKKKTKKPAKKRGGKPKK